MEFKGGIVGCVVAREDGKLRATVGFESGNIAHKDWICLVWTEVQEFGLDRRGKESRLGLVRGVARVECFGGFLHVC